MLEGTRVRLTIFGPDIDNPITTPATATVSDAKVEFRDIGRFDIQGDYYDVAATRIDIGGSRIGYRILEGHGGRFGDVDDATGFNGSALTFLALKGNASARIRAVDLVEGANTLDMPRDHITFTRDTVYANVDDLAFHPHAEWRLQLGFRLDGTGGGDVLTGDSGRDALYGRAGADLLIGGAGRDLLDGGAGNDRLRGGVGNDALRGGGGNDRLAGGGGGDRLDGGTGKDVLTGGAGADTFLFRSFKDSTPGRNRDVVTDFTRGDRIDLSALDADSGRRGDQDFDFGGTGAGAHSVWYVKQKGSVLLRADHDGDARADFEVELAGITRLTEGDFIL